jgi:hypothetical protein
MRFFAILGGNLAKKAAFSRQKPLEASSNDYSIYSLLPIGSSRAHRLYAQLGVGVLIDWLNQP